MLPVKRKKQRPDPTKKDASKLRGVWTKSASKGQHVGFVVMSNDSLKSFVKNNPEMWIDSVARQIHQKTVQHYWVNIIKQQVTGGGVSHT